MKLERSGRYLLAAGLIVAVGTASAQRPSDIGKREYDDHCATCHGIDGKGGGPFAAMLKKGNPPDLTQLSKKNGGVFPITHVYNVIEGAGAGHGSREMPIWGQRYRTELARSAVEEPVNERLYVRARILWLVEYVNHLQVK